MAIRKFRGKAMNTILAEVRDQLGEDAIILSSQELPDRTIELSVDSVAIDGGERSDIAAGRLIRLEEEATIVGRGGTSREILEVVTKGQGLCREARNRIIQTAMKEECDALSIDRQIAEGLSTLLTFDSRLPFKKKFVALLGSTGVGKTTTIAKLAARMQAAFNLKIALISLDAFRVGAGFHLQTYAGLMNLPFRMVEGGNRAASLKKAMIAFASFDLVFIDTAGCSARESARIRDLAKLISEKEEIERMLLLQAPANDVDLIASARAFDSVGYERVLISKLDESAYIGPVINTALAINKPIGFLTTGQRVPEDIEPASARRLGWMLSRSIH